MNLYTLNSSHPAPLPFRIVLSTGATRTDPATFTPAEIADAGYVEAPPKPSYDPATQRLGWDGSDWTVEDLPPPPPPTAADVDAERDRRIDAGFWFEGVFYQSRPQDRDNIADAKSAATDAVLIHGAEVGDYSWRQLLDPNGPEIFVWIAEDNSVVPMDALTVMRFGYAALAHKETLIFKARALKNMDPIPADYADDSWWQ